MRGEGNAPELEAKINTPPLWPGRSAHLVENWEMSVQRELAVAEPQIEPAVLLHLGALAE